MQTEFPESIFLKIDELSGLPLKAGQLFEQQLKDWKMASDGYQSLSSVQVKTFEFDNYSIEAHFNPGRIISSSAKVDAKSINERPCFLCPKNLPPEQKAVKVHQDYILLVNPFPIFNKHFTIPTTKHTPQQIKTEIENLLTISSLLGREYVVFYNGPKCGASAPDHMHFQAGDFGFMTIDADYAGLSKSNSVSVSKSSVSETRLITGCLRNFISIESSDMTTAVLEFNRIYNSLVTTEQDEEPLINVVCSFDKIWRLLIFPRVKHRPTYFFEEGDKKILISPAAVDMGGVLIFPREEDFEKITHELIVDVFKQVTFTDEQFDLLLRKLKNS
jgi:ATP adenylyltransferase/5',5'''-P-1,P-4-tetraphosphate phosphorylase II